MKCKQIFPFFLLLWCFSSEAMTLNEFIDDMVIRHGFDKAYLMQLFEKTEIQDSVIRLMTPKPTTGKSSPWYRYRQKFISDSRVESGVRFWRKHDQTLKRAEIEYGVPAKIIVAIIGVETIFGANQGNYRVLNALTTLAFYVERRAEFFRQELEDFLLMTREQGINPLTLKGSYAGAMGLGQFMPSSYRNYAIDFNGDGKKDIWNDAEDAIGSIANYFKQHGWQTGGEIVKATQVSADGMDFLANLDMKPAYNLGYLKKKGLLFYGTQSDYQLASFLDLETEQGMAYWVTFENFYVITRYNHSERYAMAVYQLGQEIENAYEQM